MSNTEDKYSTEVKSRIFTNIDITVFFNFREN